MGPQDGPDNSHGLGRLLCGGGEQIEAEFLPDGRIDWSVHGATSDTLSIANVEVADEGGYYCIVNNDSGVPAQSVQGLLGVKRRIAYWDFESGNANSTVAGSPVSFLHNDPNFVVAGGIIGDAME